MHGVEGPPAAELLRSAAAAFSVDLEAPTVLRRARATVVRAHSVRGPVVGTVIIKQFRPIRRDHFLRERAGLGLLSGLPELEGLVPRLLADDEAVLVLLIADVAEHASYSDLISSGDPAAALRTLNDTAWRLGVLHGCARSLIPEFSAMVPKWSTPGSHLRDSAGATLAFLRRALLPGVSDAAADEFAVGSEVHSQLIQVADHVDEPSALSTITVGDLAPSNVLLGAQGPVFIDLEYCGVRHAFYDAMFWHCIRPFSRDTTAEMDVSYREGLRSTGVRIDDERFLRTMLLFMSHRLFWTLSWHIEALFEQDRDVVPGVSGRRTVRAYLREYSRIAAELQGLEQSVLPGVVRRLEERLWQLWPEAAPAD